MALFVFGPMLFWKNSCNRQRSYFKWGLEEIQRRINNAPVGFDDYEIVNLFVQEMEEKACENRHTSIMFSCAADAGKYILDGFMTTYM